MNGEARSAREVLHGETTWEWLRLRPSGGVHAWDAHVHTYTAACGARNVNGRTNRIPERVRTCRACEKIAGPRMSQEPCQG